MKKDYRWIAVSITYLVLLVFAALLLSFVFGNAGGYRDQATWDSILLNLGTELLGVTVVFLIIQIALLGREWSLVDRVDNLLNELIASRRRPTASEFFIPKPNITKNIEKSRKIDLSGEARLMHHVPTISIKGFDTDNPTVGHIYVEFYPFKVDDKIHFEVDGNDPIWFTYYRDYFEELWKSSTKWEPQN